MLRSYTLGMGASIATCFGCYGCELLPIVPHQQAYLGHSAFVSLPSLRERIHDEVSECNENAQRNCLLILSALVEAMRRVRCRDDALNSILGGATAAYVLVGIHRESYRDEPCSFPSRLCSMAITVSCCQVSAMVCM